MSETAGSVEETAASALPIKKLPLQDLVGKSLDDFRVQQYAEVYRTDDDGRISKSIGCFKDETVAAAFAQNQVDATWHQTRQVFLLTDGKVGFVIGESVHLMDNKQAALEIRQAALAKLTPEERTILGI